MSPSRWMLFAALALAVPSHAQLLTSTPPFLTLTGLPGGTAPAGQQISATVLGAATAPFTVATQVVSPTGGKWLIATPTTATAPTAVSVSVNTAGLAAGTYNGSVTLTGTINSVVTMVTLTVPPTGPVPGVFPPAVNFTYQVGDPLPLTPKLVSVSNLNFLGVAAKYSGSVTGSLAFQLTNPTGQTFGNIGVTVPQPGTTPGTFQGTLAISVPGGTPATLNVPLTLTVTAAPPPNLAITPPTVSYAGVQGGGILTSVVQIANAGGGTPVVSLMAKTTTGGNWLTVAQPGHPVTKTNPAFAQLVANPAGLAPGTYRGTILAVSTPATTINSVAVTMVIAPGAQTMSLSSQALTFSGSTTVSIPAQSFFVGNSGQGAMSWTATPSTLTGGKWLQVSPASGTSTAGASVLPPLNVTVNPAGLAAGRYSGTVQVASSTANNAPQAVSVAFTVRAAGTAPPEPALSEYGTAMVAALNAAKPSTETLQVMNLGGPVLNFAAGAGTDDGANWLSITPASGTVTGGGSTPVTLNADPTGLSAGIYYGTVRVFFSDGTFRSMRVAFSVAPGAQTAACTATSLIPQILSLEDLFDINALDPVDVTVRVLDNCGTPLTSGTVQIGYSNGDPSQSLTQVGNGVWTAPWLPGTPQDPITLSVSAQSISAALSGQTSLTGSLLSPSNPDALMQAVVNSASNAGNGLISPGLGIAIFGQRFADAAAVASTSPLPTTLGGLQVALNNTPLPLQFVNANQINGIVPYGAAANTQQQLTITRDGVVSAPLLVTVTDAQPAIYTLNQQGSGQGSILIANSLGILAAPVGTTGNSRPAHHGEYLELFCTGLGSVNNAPADGAPAPAAEPLARTSIAPTVTIGGQNVSVLYAGLAPGLIGVYQVNVGVEPAVPVGGAVPIIVTVGSQASNTATVAVDQ